MFQRIETSGGHAYYQTGHLPGAGARALHAFSTRQAGDGLDAITAIAAALGCEKRTVVTVRQVHGAAVADAKHAADDDSIEADALVTDNPDLLLAIRTADCVPLLLAGAAGRVVAAVHAGWRGIVAGVIPQTVEVMAGRFGLDASHLRVAIGPCISRRHFEVGPEVVQAFEAAGLGEVVDHDDQPRPHIDLTAAAALQLIRAGVPSASVASLNRCTFADADEFYSYRRDGSTGRLVAIIGAVG